MKFWIFFHIFHLILSQGLVSLCCLFHYKAFLLFFNIDNVIFQASAFLFSSPEPKDQVSFSDQNLSVVRRRRFRRRCRCRKLFTFSSSFSRTTGPISTKLSKRHPWVEGIQVCSNEGPTLF